MSQIMGIDKGVFFCLIFAILLIILGVVTFHFYSYATTNKNRGFSVGGGVGVDLNLPRMDHSGSGMVPMMQ